MERHVHVGKRDEPCKRCEFPRANLRHLTNRELGALSSAEAARRRKQGPPGRPPLAESLPAPEGGVVVPPSELERRRAARQRKP